MERVDDLVDVVLVLSAETEILVEVFEAHLPECLHDLFLVDFLDALFDFLAVVDLTICLGNGVCALKLVRLRS